MFGKVHSLDKTKKNPKQKTKKHSTKTKHPPTPPHPQTKQNKTKDIYGFKWITQVSKDYVNGGF